MGLLDVFANVGEKIRSYFWKLGYLAGRFFGQAGQRTFDDAFSAGLSSVALDNVDLEGMMSDFENHWMSQMNSWADEMTNELGTAANAVMMMKAMAPLLFSDKQEEVEAAYAMFTGEGWEYSAVTGTNNGTTFTEDPNGTQHMMVTWTGKGEDGAPTSVTKRIGHWFNPELNETVVVVVD